jgi:hypothetical protein
MTSSLLSAQGRASAELFFRKLFGSTDLDCVFSSMASIFTAADGSPERYSRIAQKVIKNTAAHTSVSAADLTLLAKIVRPLALLNDRGGRKATTAFVKLLETSVVGMYFSDGLDLILELMAEFVSPYLGRMQVDR